MSPSNAGTLRGTAGTTRAAGAAERAGFARWGPALAGWALPFLVVVVLGLDNGGYDVGIRSEVGIAIWWIILVGVASGMVKLSRVGRAGWIGVGLLAAFGLWTALGISWSESSERSVTEVARVLTYLGVFVLALAVQGREGLRRTIAGTAAGIALIALIALLSRLQPDWFSAAQTNVEGFEVGQQRLNFPLNYWNGLAALVAIGLPLLLTIGLRARSLIVSALSTAAVPMLAVTGFYTLSRGGAAEALVAIAVLVALYPKRLAALPTLLLAGVSSAILVAAATQRDALENGLLDGVADSQRSEMIALVLVVCIGVGFLQYAIGLAARHGLGPRLEIPRRVAAGASAVAVLTALVIAIAAGLPGQIEDTWQDFKQPEAPSAQDAARFESAAGSFRYQTWEAAVDANGSAPLLGIGPGTYEFWWAENGSEGPFVRDAHSLYLETLGELGIIGFVLIVALVGGVLAIGVSRSMRASEDRRALLAGATAACAAFAVAAAIDWAWELAVLPCAFLMLAAAIAGPAVVRKRVPRSADDAGDREESRLRPLALRGGAAGAALIAIVAIAIPYAGASAVGESRDQARSADVGGALDRVDTAASIQPYAATPKLQEALLLERAGSLGAAATAAREATMQESTNWRTWLVLSRIEAFRGDAQASVDAYREAKALNPRSPLFEESDERAAP